MTLLDTIANLLLPSLRERLVAGFFVDPGRLSLRALRRGLGPLSQTAISVRASLLEEC